jgi:phosphoglycerate dehydrogenase-like enzyme
MPLSASLLFALGSEEIVDFLPEPLLSRAKKTAASCSLFDPTASSETDFHRALAALDPEVLVAGWRTPRLPPSLPPRLRYVCYLCGSVKKLVSRAHLEEGLLVTNWGNSISRVVAEWALFHILSCLRNASYWAVALHRDGGWKTPETRTASLFGRPVGIHGYGAVARELVRLLAPFENAITVFAPEHGDLLPASVGRAESLDELFFKNDIVVELAPLIDETRGIVTEKLLRRLRPGSVFINLGRGALVDEDALVRVAREGRISIGLDVFAHEPLDPQHPLRGLPNVTLTPHIGGPTTDRRSDAGLFAVENLEAYAGATPLRAIVTPTIYDRSS